MRTHKEYRQTKETAIAVRVELDAAGGYEIKTGVGFMDHMLEQFAKHGAIGLWIEGGGDLHIDQHHLVEDLGITLGKCIDIALGDRKGICRYASARVAMDEALVEVDLDLCTRQYLYYNLPLNQEKLGEFDTMLMPEFWRAFSNNCRLTMHMNLIRGSNAHHILEAAFKAFAITFRRAICVVNTDCNSTKGML